MRVILSRYTGQAIERNKTLINQRELNVTWKEGTSVNAPTLSNITGDVSGFNYAEIPDFGRKYFITSTGMPFRGLREMTLKCDVLASADLSKSWGILKSNAVEYNLLIDDNQMQAFSKPVITVNEFPQKFDRHSLILITAGGASNENQPNP